MFRRKRKSETDKQFALAIVRAIDSDPDLAIAIARALQRANRRGVRFGLA